MCHVSGFLMNIVDGGLLLYCELFPGGGC